jgi:hypothetical protein
MNIWLLFFLVNEGIIRVRINNLCIIMRLLELQDDGKLCRTRNITVNIPPYAILSHTWAENEEDEVNFHDLGTDAPKHKIGYNKIQFCRDQAALDHLKYFWIDTCCIDQSNNAEFSEAINSMFRWYRNAARCYVYLPDVCIASANDNGQPHKETWISAFRASRWFTRGWTLQELLAPKSVEFYSLEGIRLGDKDSLEQKIHDITRIPVEALRGSPLTHFTVSERMAWAARRETKREEDIAYSLMGIFDVFMPPIYGEGRDNARIRLREMIDRRSHGEFITVEVFHKQRRIYYGSETRQD